jgi:hypothetical protein
VSFRRRVVGDTLITNENLTDVPPDKEDKCTADDELSPKQADKEMKVPVD